MVKYTLAILLLSQICWICYPINSMGCKLIVEKSAHLGLNLSELDAIEVLTHPPIDTRRKATGKMRRKKLCKKNLAHTTSKKKLALCTRPFACPDPECQKKCKRIGSLKVHINTKHPDKAEQFTTVITALYSKN